MITKKQVLVTSRVNGTVEIFAMRYNASHQRGWRCYLGALADNPGQIDEDSVPSFQGQSLFEALSVIRGIIEASGGRLLHAIAGRECWPDPLSNDRFCRRLTAGSADTELIDGFLPIDRQEAATLDEQRAAYEAWRLSLPVTEAEMISQSEAGKALHDSNTAIRAARETAILSRGDLPPSSGNES